jgi:hypothetical protein
MRTKVRLFHMRRLIAFPWSWDDVGTPCLRSTPTTATVAVLVYLVSYSIARRIAEPTNRRSSKMEAITNAASDIGLAPGVAR